MPMLVCNIGWMAAYEGIVGQPDRIVGGGAWVREHKDGGETCNFVECDEGYVYGHVETIKGEIDRPLSLELLGARPGAEFVDHIDVIWVATHPTKKGRWVVGWYRDARVYRERVAFKKAPSAQHKLETPKPDFRIRTRAANAFVIPLKQRTIQLGRGKGWIGQANWWFAERNPNAAVNVFLSKVRALLDAGLQPEQNSPPGGGRWGGKADPVRNAEVERAAISRVIKYFANYKIKSVEKDNLGWDLEARHKGASALRLEVKGLFGQELKVGLTPREYCAFDAHLNGTMPNYRLCVVAGALSKKSKLVVFRFDQESRQWVDDHSARKIEPQIAPIQAAIVSLD